MSSASRSTKIIVLCIFLFTPLFLAIPPGSATAYVTTRAGNVDAVARQSHAVFQLLKGGSFGTMDYDALSDEVYVPDARKSLQRS